MHILVQLFDNGLKFFLFELSFIEVGIYLAFDAIYFIIEVIEHFLFAQFLLLKERTNDVFGLVSILECNIE